MQSHEDHWRWQTTKVCEKYRRLRRLLSDTFVCRYEILDIEPESDTLPEKVSPLSLVAIPPPGTAVHEVVKGQQVFALYPGTSTFYRADVVSMKGKEKDHCRLKFEGEEEKGKEQEVERRYVLDVKRCER